MTIEPFIEHVAPFALVVSRLAGLIIITPMLSNRMLPTRFRALIAIMFAAAMYPMLPGEWHLPPEANLVSLAPLLASELLIGVSIGFIAGLPVLALNMGGYIMSYQMGFGLARVYNPELGQESDIAGQLLTYIGMAIFITIGGLEVVFVALLNTFERVPIGEFGINRLPLEVIVGILGSAFELAIRIAAPVLCIIMLVMIAMGFIMKTMPQINILSVGFPLKILIGLGMLIFALFSIRHAAAEEIESVLGIILEWSRNL